jgi:serine/threonine-protein kinase
MAVEPVESSTEELVGQIINGKYRLLRLLGAGGMGAVYEAEDPMLRKRVALKLMKASIANNEQLVERFVREARAADAINHRNIVRVIELARDSSTGLFYIVQELLVGENLADRLEREGRFSCSDALTMISPILDALGEAHQRGILHRDVKPENVFLHQGPQGEIIPKLIDFGISKMTDALPGLAKTQTGTALGTPYYMSPEQVRGDSTIDRRADLWSAAVMMFELITGQRPFRGENYNILILRIMTDRAPSALSIEPSIPSAVSAVIAKALDPIRDNRYATAGQLRDALQAAVESEGQRLTAPIDLRPHSPVTAVLPATDAYTLDATLDEAPVDSSAKRSLIADTDVARVDQTQFELGATQAPMPAKPQRAAMLIGASLFVLVAVAGVVGVSLKRRATLPTAPSPATTRQLSVHPETQIDSRPTTPVQPHVEPQTAASSGSLQTVRPASPTATHGNATTHSARRTAVSQAQANGAPAAGTATTVAAQSAASASAAGSANSAAHSASAETTASSPATAHPAAQTTATQGTTQRVGMQRFAPITNYP